jgi:hypothetical protein
LPEGLFAQKQPSALRRQRSLLIGEDNCRANRPPMGGPNTATIKWKESMRGAWVPLHRSFLLKKQPLVLMGHKRIRLNLESRSLSCAMKSRTTYHAPNIVSHGLVRTAMLRGDPVIEVTKLAASDVPECKKLAGVDYNFRYEAETELGVFEKKEPLLH